MELIEILKYPDPKLRIKAKPLDKDNISADISFIKNLAYTMYKADGVGLAATQVGINKRVIVIDMSRKSNKSKIFSLGESNILTENEGLVIAVNPEIIFRDGKTVYEEGCLSIPGFNADIERAEYIRVKTINVSGEKVVLEAKDLLAVAFQHEIDHLNGTLFIDKVSPLKRSLHNAFLKKAGVAKRGKSPSYI
ncbi:peptide deformylase [Candidatus Acidulodesulfobacterium sp. H_13]|uniref:peptide deformylase n=1 Tax=Candidatus Acidulodesulfobacterium sp. H_13 TaxID=3395470 RepID=UPI003AF9B3A6